MMIDRTRKRDNRDKQRNKRWKVHSRSSIEGVMNAVKRRAEKVATLRRKRQRSD